MLLFNEFKVVSQKEKMQRHQEDWISFGYKDNDLRVYFDYLADFSFIIKEVRYGINDSLPLNLLVIPSCESIKNIKALDLELYRTIPPSTKKMSILLRYNDNTQSPVSFYNIKIID
jgi:hypothetical protein